MKKRVFFMAIITMVLALGLGTFMNNKTAAVETQVVDFDVNDDGKVDIVDFILVKSATINAEPIGNTVPAAETVLRFQQYMLSTVEEIVTTAEITTQVETTSVAMTTNAVSETTAENTVVATTEVMTTIVTEPVTSATVQQKSINLQSEGKTIKLSDLQLCEKYVIDEEKEIITLINDNISYYSSYDQSTVRDGGAFRSVVMVENKLFCIFSKYSNYFILPCEDKYLFNKVNGIKWEDREYYLKNIVRSQAYDIFMKVFFEAMFEAYEGEEGRSSYKIGEVYIECKAYGRTFQMYIDGDKTIRNEDDLLLYTYKDKTGTITYNLYGSANGYYVQYIIE